MKNEKPEPAVVTSGSVINFLNKFGVFRKFIELAQDLYDLYVPIIMSRAKRKNYRRVTLIYCCDTILQRNMLFILLKRNTLFIPLFILNILFYSEI